MVTLILAFIDGKYQLDFTIMYAGCFLLDLAILDIIYAYVTKTS
jgi:hypothetical protein